MQPDVTMQSTLVAIHSVLAKIKPVVPSPNFDELLEVVMLGLWEPKRKFGAPPAWVALHINQKVEGSA